MNDARKDLRESEMLLNRMSNLMHIDITTDEEVNNNEETTEKLLESLNEKKINAVFENMWKFNQTYKISTENMIKVITLSSCILHPRLKGSFFKQTI